MILASVFLAVHFFSWLWPMVVVFWLCLVASGLFDSQVLCVVNFSLLLFLAYAVFPLMLFSLAYAVVFFGLHVDS